MDALRRPSLRALALGLLAALLVGLDAAGAEYETLALTTDPATNYDYFSNGILAESGTVAAQGAFEMFSTGLPILKETDGVGGLADLMVILQDAPDADPPGEIILFSGVAYDGADRLAIRAFLDVGLERTALYLSDGPGVLDKVWMEGDLVPSLTPPTRYGDPWRSVPPQMNPSGGIVEVIPILEDGGGFSGEALFLPSGPGTIAPTLREGDPAPGVPGAGLFRFPQVVLDTAGDVAFRGLLLQGGGIDASNDDGIWMPDGLGGFSLVAREGDAAPGAGRAYGELDVLGGNAAGDVAFGDGAGLWRRRVGQAVEHVVESGDPAPGAPAGSVFAQLSLVGLLDDGRLAVWATAGPSGGPSEPGLWLELPGGGLGTLALRGQEAPSLGPGVTWAELEVLALNGAGQLRFDAELGGAAGPGNDYAQLAVDAAGEVRVLIRAGRWLEVLPDDFREVGASEISITRDTIESLPPFGTRTIDSAGGYTTVLEFTDGSSGLFASQLPVPAAPVPALGTGTLTGLAALLGVLGLARPRLRPRRRPYSSKTGSEKSMTLRVSVARSSAAG